jgi:hypothetical protein
VTLGLCSCDPKPPPPSDAGEKTEQAADPTEARGEETKKKKRKKKMVGPRPARERTPLEVPTKLPKTGYPDTFLSPYTAIGSGTPPIRTPKWKVVEAPKAEVVLVSTHMGVLATLDGKTHELGAKGTLTPVAGMDKSKDSEFSTAGRVLGNWPTDAWRVGRAKRDGETGSRPIFHWEGAKGWSTHELRAGAQDIVRYSPRGGLVVAKASKQSVAFTRVGSKLPPPPEQGLHAGELLDVHETASGGMVLFIADEAASGGTVLRVQRSCDPESADADCVRRHTVTLPQGEAGPAQFKIGPFADHSERGFSVGIEQREAESSARRFVVQLDGDHWALDESPKNLPVVHMAGGKDDGLWVQTKSKSLGSQLWHRAANGHWVAVRLPSNIAHGAITFTRRDADHMWVTGEENGKYTTYEAPSSL